MLKGYVSESDYAQTTAVQPRPLIAALVQDLSDLQVVASEALGSLCATQDRLFGPVPRNVAGGIGAPAAKPNGEFQALSDTLDSLRGYICQLREEAQILAGRL